MRRLAVLLCLCLATLRAQQSKPPDTDELERELKRFLGVFLIASEQAADAVDPDSAYYGGAIPCVCVRTRACVFVFDKNHFKQLQEM